MPAQTAPPAEDHGETEHIRETYKERVRTSSGASVRSHPSSGGSGSRSYSSSAGSSYDLVEGPYEDDIDPSDSASHSREPRRSVRYVEARPQPSRRHSSRRVVAHELDEPQRHSSSRRHHSSRHRRHDSRRVPSDESSSETVASYDDYPPNRHGQPPRAYPPPQNYRHPHANGGHGGYPPSLVTSAPGYPEAYGARQALVHMPQQDAFGYPVNDNGFNPPDGRGNPFSPMSNASGPSYFAMDPHAPPAPHSRPPGPQRPQSYAAPNSHYGTEVMSPYGHPGMMPYPGYPMGMGGPMGQMPGYPMHGWYPPPAQQSSAPPEAKEEKPSKEYEAITIMLQKAEEARLAWQKEMVAKAAADAAAKAEQEAKAAEEKKKKEEIAEASKKAKEAAEKSAEEKMKKAKEEHETALKKAEKAKEEAEKKQKDLEAVAESLKPPDHAGKMIKFTDAIDRKFSFPYGLCKTWKGMEGLIKQAFVQVDVIGEHVRQGHYDLTGPDGEILLPQVWENMIQPDWEIHMHMWPMEEEKKKKKKQQQAEDDLMAGLLDPMHAMHLGGLGDLGIADPARKKSTKKSDGKKKAKSADANVVKVVPDLPPGAGYPPGMPMDPFMMQHMGYAMPESAKDPGKSKSKSGSSSKKKEVPSSGFAAWFAGSSAPRPSKKDDEKLELGRRKSPQSVRRSGSRHSHYSHSHHSREDDRSTGCVVM